MTEDEFKTLADKIAAKEATPSEKARFIAEAHLVLSRARSAVVQ